MGFKRFWKKLWHFIWNDNSIWSWLVNFVLAFVIIKFIVYPGLGFLLGTHAPIVAVVSGSMEHDGSLDRWWSEKTCCDSACSVRAEQFNFYKKLNISFEQFKNFSFKNGFNKGDIMFLISPKKVKIGDVIVYSAGIKHDPIIHRVVDIKVKNGKRFFTTKGDHNCGIADFEHNINENKVIGKAVLRVPWLGWVKIVFVNIVNFLVNLAR
ncbi:signal peptidase I [Candidatus Woesearchaeota archaeon]|nr:MAG: signal peptidase I [Candidatus Woesearchaeota archaeon ex4484_78]RLE46688.1 MAG: signal peptidase I [Candidatus Woesearchaeota archaeon]